MEKKESAEKAVRDPIALRAPTQLLARRVRVRSPQRSPGVDRRAAGISPAATAAG